MQNYISSSNQNPGFERLWNTVRSTKLLRANYVPFAGDYGFCIENTADSSSGKRVDVSLLVVHHNDIPLFHQAVQQLDYPMYNVYVRQMQDLLFHKFVEHSSQISTFNIHLVFL